MNDDLTNPNDELLSADLDGETTPSEHARIEADAELRSRREELRAAALLAGRPPAPLDSADVDRIVERAAGELRREDAAGTDAPPVTPAPLTRLPRPRRAPVPQLVAAAVVLLAAIGIGLIVTDGSSTHTSDKATSGASSKRADSSGGVQAPSEHGATTAPERAASGASSTTAGGYDAARAQDSLRSLGRFTTPATLRAALRTTLRSAAPQKSSSAPRVSTGQADRCATVVEARDPALLRKNRRTSLAASIGDEPVVVLEYRVRAVKSTRATTRVIALGVNACDERLNFER